MSNETTESARTFSDWMRFQEYAKNNGYDSLEFMAMFPSGPCKGKWLDAYMGLVTLDGIDGFLMVRDLDSMMPGTVCIPFGERRDD